MATLEGPLTVITGSMFSGKTEKLIEWLKRPGYIKKKILVIKPTSDNRQTRETFQMIMEHKFLRTYKFLRTQTVQNFEEFKMSVNNYRPEIIAIDEAQFFGFWIIDAIIEQLDIHDNDDEFKIAVAGLDRDFLGKGFGPIPQLLVEADNIIKLIAVCHKCGKPATLTYKISGLLNQQLEVGDGIYQARCRACHKLPK